MSGLGPLDDTASRSALRSASRSRIHLVTKLQNFSFEFLRTCKQLKIEIRILSSKNKAFSKHEEGSFQSN